ncbi:Threonine ammonia-lyase [Fasciolopsis buskii]|uniref:L-serine deaminase n=1 Tax=Fasciolopsis buskii TaxID=27845 RepID=A0A8E0S6X0_9TREM|nr:Threonine ammonia-lyase [Fasciolopsis buski]
MSSKENKQGLSLGKIETRTNIVNDLITDIPIPEVDDPDMFDPYCDPDHPVAINYRDVAAANYRIRDGIVRTPCKKSNLSKQLNMKIYLKLEFQQVTGSFKERGARNVLLQLSEEQARRGVIASSAGNHAQALAYHGKELGIPVTVVMPKIAPLMKVENCISHGANVLLKGIDMSQAKRYALKLGKINDLVYVNGYDHPQVLAGQGTIALEIMEQVPHVDAILVPVGGGGLLAGVAVAVKGINPHIQVIGVESDNCASFGVSLAAGKPVYTHPQPTVADGLAVPLVGYNSLHTCLELVDKMVSVDEAHIHRTIVRLLEIEKCVVEGAGTTALAALMAGLLPELEGKTVVPIISGGNIDTTVLGRVIERGLAFEGRMCRFLVIVSDRPGGIAELCSVLRDLGVSIKDIFHERAWLISSIFSVQVKCVCETRDANHAALLERTLREKYEHVLWGPAAV